MTYAKRRIIRLTWLSFLMALCLLPGADDRVSQEEKTRADIDWMLKSMSVYESRFQMGVLFGREWQDIRDGLNRLKNLVGSQINADNINTARQQLDAFRSAIDRLLKKREAINFRVFSAIQALFAGIQPVLFDQVPFILDLNAIIAPSVLPEAPDPDAINCPEDEANYRNAVIAEVNSSRYQSGSARQALHLAEAIRLFGKVSRSSCLPENNRLKSYARSFIRQKMDEIEKLDRELDRGNLKPGEKSRLLKTVSPEGLEELAKLEPDWAASLKLDSAALMRSRKSADVPVLSDAEAGIPRKKPEAENQTAGLRPDSPETVPELPRRLEPVADMVHWITLDVWQSAWGTFEGLEVLLDYLRRNRIKRINLNPGLPMGPKFYQEGYEKLKPLVEKFYRGGIEHIGFLYAELNYPIEYYANFLRRYPDLNIDTLVDDSEFVDMFSTHFEQNVRNVKKYGIRYSAFVTLESEGNSGVSDQTRFWVLDHVDYPILMSYFGCSLEEQKNKLEKYLQYADRRGIKRRVGIAILLGSKKVGREESCERLLNEEQMKTFLRDLHAWAASRHPSYAGIVLETNLKMPRMNVHWQAER